MAFWPHPASKKNVVGDEGGPHRYAAVALASVYGSDV